MRSRQLLTLVALGAFVTITLLMLKNPDAVRTDGLHLTRKPLGPTQKPSSVHVSSSSHPISVLINEAELDFKEKIKSQSKTLADAVTEYKRRYKMHPPPNFDKWYAFAKEKGVQFIDEYDSIYDSLLPFWSVKPSVIRGRCRESLGFNDNNLMGLAIRGGKAVNVARAEDWQQKSTVGMMAGFIQHLPDMDLAFNIHDESRVVLPHEDLAKLVKKAKTEVLPLALANPVPLNRWSTRPEDVKEDGQFEEFRITKFNHFAHQPVWAGSRSSCSPDSAARSLDENPADDTEAYAYSKLNLIRNHTAFSDICNSPSLRDSFGFFERPNAWNVIYDLFPIFSQSKVSSFQDILYPSPWYWADKVLYKARKDYSWDEKTNKLYWRGSTTGGFSRNGGWRRQHRQKIVKSINGLDKTNILELSAADAKKEWNLKEVPKPDFQELFDVQFSHVGQCDPGDCEAQKEFFKLAKPAAQDDAWGYKYLLDIDGNAFSGRFYAFLKSRSLTFKMAVFREWHEEWLRPWLHYVPLTLNGAEYVEVLRFFEKEEEGKTQAVKLAIESQEWADKMLRHEDFEVWFFRLLLEYGRIVDDDREKLGYVLK